MADGEIGGLGVGTTDGDPTDGRVVSDGDLGLIAVPAEKTPGG